MTRNSPESLPPVGIVVGYGDLPAALRAAVLSIINEPDALEAVSSVSRQAEGLDDRLEEAVARHAGRRVLMFADLYGSSCAHGGAGFRDRHPGTAVLCGVNLPMLVRFLYYRQRLEYRELVEFLRRSGQEGIREA